MIRIRESLLAVFALVLVLALRPGFGADNKPAQKDQAQETVRGQVQRVAADHHQLLVRDQQGRELAIQVGRDAKVQVNDRESRLEDLKEGDQVTVNLVRVVRDIRSGQKGQAQRAIRGQVARVAADQRQLVLKDREGKEETLRVARDAHIRSGDKDQQLADLKEGDEVVVIAEQEGSAWTAQAIRSQTKGQPPQIAQGLVQRVAADQNQLVLKDPQGRERTFHVGREVKVHVAGKEGNIANIKEGDQVSVLYRLTAREIRSERKNP